MDITSHLDLLPALGVITIGIFSALLAVLAWLGNKMYDKLQSIELLFLNNIAAAGLRFSGIEGRILRLEDKVAIIDRRNFDLDRRRDLPRSDSPHEHD